MDAIQLIKTYIEVESEITPVALDPLLRVYRLPQHVVMGRPLCAVVLLVLK